MTNTLENINPGDRVEYKERVVGRVRLDSSIWVFEWYQKPFRKFSNSETTVYGMGEGLKEQLEQSKIQFIEIDDEHLVHTKDIDDYNIITPDHEIFKRPPDEKQYLIQVENK